MQAWLGELAATLEHTSLRKLTARLNKADSNRLPAMWELVILRGLAIAGELLHEKALPNGRRPDFQLLLVDNPHRLIVCGEISTVSDAGLHKQNPVGILRSEIDRLALKYRLNPNHFRYDVDGGHVGAYKTGRIALKLPSPQRLQSIIKQKVKPFIRELAKQPRPLAHFEYGDDTNFSIGYDQTQRFAGGGHPSYETAISLTNNSVFKALKQKVGQLSAASEDTIRLIILCDGGCTMMNRRGMSSLNAPAIAQDFLRQHSSIDLVLLVSVTRTTDSYGTRELAPHFELVVPRIAARHKRLNSDALKIVHKALERAVASIPQAVREPINAAHHCLLSGYGRGMAGGYMTGKTIKISSRALLELLSGQISSDSFLELHGWDAPVGKSAFATNSFKQALNSGRMIKTVHVEYGGNKDDDWLEFEFGAPDAAFSPFVVPEVNQSNNTRSDS